MQLQQLHHVGVAAQRGQRRGLARAAVARCRSAAARARWAAGEDALDGDVLPGRALLGEHNLRGGAHTNGRRGVCGQAATRRRAARNSHRQAHLPKGAGAQ